jgi:hypothetical protein
MPELVDGPLDGVHVLLEPKGSKSLVVSFDGGDSAIYRRDAAGTWKFDSRPAEPVLTDDAILDEVVRTFGLKTLIEVLAVVAVREATRGDFQYWNALAARLERKSSS